MDAYWRSDKLTFSSGGKTTRGWEATRDQYLKNYPDRKTMGTLKFTELEVQQLDDKAALMLGRWHLTRDQPVGGNFSLVWQKDRWQVGYYPRPLIQRCRTSSHCRTIVPIVAATIETNCATLNPNGDRESAAPAKLPLANEMTFTSGLGPCGRAF